jgi:ATP-dependent Clp protease ATP-binding subunit ClpC
MQERFSEGARQVVAAAQEEAGALDHDYVGTEHLLLGLVRDADGVAGRALAALGVELAQVREQAVQVRPPRDPIPGKMPLTARSQRVLELASEEALEHGRAHIGTEHILLALVRGDGGPGARILRDLGIGADRVEDAIDGLTT